MIDANRVLVIDPITDATETAPEAFVCLPEPRAHQDGMKWGERQPINGEAVRRLYSSPSAESYGEGSYTITRTDYERAVERKYDMTADQISKIIEDSDLWIFGIRALHPDEAVSVGDEMPESYIWDDGDRTDESIGGTCCFCIQETGSGAQDALDRAMSYRVTLGNRRYALLGGKYTGNNDLIEEAHTIAIRDARVLAVWEERQ